MAATPESPTSLTARAASHPSWSAELGARVRWHFVLKTFGTAALVGLFFAGYFYLQRHPSSPPTVMPLTVLDDLIPFLPSALIAYISLFVYVGVGPGLQRTYADLLAYGLWLGLLGISALAFFCFWPTQTPPVTLDEPGFFGFLHQIDASGNACPSMHVAVATFTAIRIHEVLSRIATPIWLKSLNWVWCCAIVYSTLAIKQHVVLDVGGGVLLGTAVAMVSLLFPVRAPLQAGGLSLTWDTDLPAPTNRESGAMPARVTGRRR